jgi:hypothetical protein
VIGDWEEEAAERYAAGQFAEAAAAASIAMAEQIRVANLIKVASLRSLQVFEQPLLYKKPSQSEAAMRRNLARTEIGEVLFREDDVPGRKPADA